jgi:hypothetical protein
MEISSGFVEVPKGEGDHIGLHVVGMHYKSVAARIFAMYGDYRLMEEYVDERIHVHTVTFRGKAELVVKKLEDGSTMVYGENKPATQIVLNWLNKLLIRLNE